MEEQAQSPSREEKERARWPQAEHRERKLNGSVGLGAAGGAFCPGFWTIAATLREGSHIILLSPEVSSYCIYPLFMVRSYLV